MSSREHCLRWLAYPTQAAKKITRLRPELTNPSLKPDKLAIDRGGKTVVGRQHLDYPFETPSKVALLFVEGWKQIRQKKKKKTPLSSVVLAVRYNQPPTTVRYNRPPVAVKRGKKLKHLLASQRRERLRA